MGTGERYLAIRVLSNDDGLVTIDSYATSQCESDGASPESV